jgi:DNA-binding LytR/AlgR family response regulator
MPDMTGFEVLRRLPDRRMPLVIFVTAHDEHALKAFDAQAVDYLLKPIDDGRFASTLERARLLRGTRRLPGFRASGPQPARGASRITFARWLQKTDHCQGATSRQHRAGIRDRLDRCDR